MTRMCTICFLVVLWSFPAFAQNKPNTNENTKKEAAEYKDVEALKALEVEQFKAIQLLKSEFDLDLIAPNIGIIATVRTEMGVSRAKNRVRGSALFSVPKFRSKLLATEVLGLKKQDEPSVRAYVDFFDGRGKPILAKWISRMGRYRPMIENKLREAGMPTDLIYVAMIESGFSPFARSPAAAVGVWQFIPSTGRMMGLRIDGWIDERRDPELATDAAIQYLGDLHRKFGSWELALASYNGGQGLVGKTISRLNTNNYWLIQRRNGLYDETRRYVPKVLAAGLVTKNADIFGLDAVSTEKSIEFDLVTVPSNTRFKLVAHGARVDIGTIRMLNPKFLGSQTPPNGGPFEIRIPKKSMEKFVKRYDAYVKKEGAEHIRYTVRFGETLKMISARVGVPERVIRVANGFSNRERSPYGTTVLIPTLKSKPSKKKTKKGKTLVVVPTKGFSTVGKTRYFYRVNSGDTLELIGRGLDLNVSDLVLWNEVDPKATLRKGMVLQVFLSTESSVDAFVLLDRSQVEVVAKGSMAAKKKLAKRKRGRKRKGRFYHRVRSGESLWIIAHRYKGVTVMDLRRWNPRLRRSNLLQPGDKLVIYPKKK